MSTTIHEATIEDLEIARNLVPYYIYDMSGHMRWACSGDGKFDGCDELPTYWQEEGKFAFILRDDEEVVGFALVRGNHDEPDIDYSIAEFFVLRKFRNKGIGERIACELFDRFRGRWMVTQMSRNMSSLSFWRKIIKRYTRNTYTETDGSSEWGPINEIRFSNTEGSYSKPMPADADKPPRPQQPCDTLCDHNRKYRAYVHAGKVCLTPASSAPESPLHEASCSIPPASGMFRQTAPASSGEHS